MNDRPVPTVTRDQLATTFSCSHAELGRLLRERLVPMPVRIEGAILWFADEVAIAIADGHIPGLLARRRQHRAQAVA